MPYCPATARPETPRPPPTRRPGPQFNDDQLKWGRLDFIKLADLEQVQAFVQAGADYAERTDGGSECRSKHWGVSLQCQHPCCAMRTCLLHAHFQPCCACRAW